MYPATFDYYRPKNLEEALALLRKKKDCKLLAGGHSLLPAMKMRVSTPSALIDIGRLRELDDIKIGKSVIKLGGLTTHAAVAESKEIRSRCTILSEAAEMIGDIQVRNRGTIGGSLAHADPAADYPTVMVALEAEITVAGSRGKRRVAAEEFFVDLFTTALKSDEILSEVSVSTMRKGEGGTYLKHRHPASSYAVVGVAAHVAIKNNVCKSVRLVVGGATVVPVLVRGVEEVLLGEKPSVNTIATAADRVAESLESPLSDLYASGEYRAHLATVLARRALAEAFRRAQK